jgi:hypothetical protein
VWTEHLGKPRRLHPTHFPTCMLTLRPFSRGIEVGGLCPKGSNHCHFHCAPGFATPVLAHMLNSSVRVTRRGKENHFATQPVSQTEKHRDLKSLAVPCSVPPTGRDNAGHSAPTASGRGSMTRLALVSFASVSAISGTL